MMIKHLSTLTNLKYTHSLKSLSGLPIPVLEITNQQEPEYNKKVVLITSRVHPGQSNSSFVAQGILEFLCGNQNIAKQLRKKYLFYIIPMLNPDGVVAGNYRTSLFGKDLNRTFDQSRKNAFPQSFHLIEFAKQLKMKHKKRFSFYLDLHGHSVKKNVFMYGPDFGIQTSNYELCRQLPRLLSSITSLFRFYSCIFRITSEKSTTSRAILNKVLNIPYAYTMQSSNGFYFDSISHTEKCFTGNKWKQMGVFLCKALNLLKLDEKTNYIRIKNNRQASINRQLELNSDEKYQNNSDNEISQGKSDSQPQDQDLSEQELRRLQKKIQGKPIQTDMINKSQNNIFQKPIHKQISPKKHKRQKSPVFLPPINTFNRAIIFSNRRGLKQNLRQERQTMLQIRLRNIETTIYGPGDRLPKSYFAVFQNGTEYQYENEIKSATILKRQGRKDFMQRLKNLK